MPPRELGLMTADASDRMPVSEMAQRVRDFDWARTPLGPRAGWSPSLTLIVEVILASGFPMAVRWGSDLITIYNDAYRPILGDKHPAALGLPTRDVWPEIFDELGPLTDAILTGEREGFFDLDHLWPIHRRGTLREDARFTISYSPIPDPAAPNGIGGVLTTCVETTARVRSEQALRTLNERLEDEIAERIRERDRIWQVSEDLLGVTNFAGYFISINPAWSALLGWSEDEIRGLHVDALRHPDDAEHSRAGRAQLAQGAARVRMENRFRHKDGSWRRISWTMTAAQGLIYTIGRDVTAEKAAADKLLESERQFRLLVEGVTDHALIMLDPKGFIASWNIGAERISGYRQNEIVGRHFSCLYPEADRDAGLPEHALAIATRTGSYRAEGLRRRGDGTLFLASVSIDALRDERGALTGFAKITRDITERHEAQLALQRAQEQLAQSQKIEALGQLTGGIAHDFNNMLMVVSGHAQSLKGRLKDARDRRAIEAVELAARRGERLTRQLLAFSRSQALNPTVIRLAERLEAFRDVLTSSARGDIALAIDLAEDSWPVAVDVPELELALVNIVVNARDAMPDGGRITITSENLALRGDETAEHLEGDFLALKIADTGGGIAPEIMSKVFEPFFTTKPVNKGTGLGLSQVYGFTRQSGGTTAIASEPGIGTAVTIYLPRSRDDASGNASEPQGTEENATGSEAILLVEDNVEVQAVAGMLLRQLGYRVDAVDNAAAAIERLAAGHAVDLVFSDVVMPGEMDGIALARRIRIDYPDIPVLLTSGYAKAASQAKGFPILRKPYRLTNLSRAIRDAIEAQQRIGKSA
ncbi:MAG TPA: PAS domain S-box protein [Stellaceae bacterium]|nr:PAS domain S-box protein [Stellaceae bacterium]